MADDIRIKITEIFYSIQGESSHAGRPCVFIRLTGCDLRCSWCDTEYSFSGGEWLTADQILEKVRTYECSLVEVTGGEPLLQKDVLPLMSRLCDEGFEVLLETSGASDARDVDARVARILDVKCPGSGEDSRNFWPNLEDLRPKDEIKFVIAHRHDYEYARAVISDRQLENRTLLPLMSAVHNGVQLDRLAAWILEDRLRVRFQIQLHKFIWGPDVIGV